MIVLQVRSSWSRSSCSVSNFDKIIAIGGDESPMIASRLCRTLSGSPGCISCSGTMPRSSSRTLGTADGSNKKKTAWARRK